MFSFFLKESWKINKHAKRGLCNVLKCESIKNCEEKKRESKLKDAGFGGIIRDEIGSSVTGFSGLLFTWDLGHKNALYWWSLIRWKQLISSPILALILILVGFLFKTLGCFNSCK